MKIGNIQLENNIFLAPMAGVTDMPFRVICKEYGVGLVYSELISGKGINFNNKKTIDLLQTDKKERPVAIQLFGRDSKILGEVVKKIEHFDFDILDFNLGCPAPKVVKNGEGSALMKEPKVVEEIATALVKNSKKPITFKIRKGFENSNNAVEISKILEGCGVSAIAVHGRTREEYYSGVADLSIIKEVKENVKIPVIGNGDIVDGKTAKNMFDYTNCDGIMVGRGARGNPFIFREILEYLKTGNIVKATDEEKIKVALKHIKMLIQCKGEYVGIRESRSHLGWYIKGMYKASESKVLINKATTYEQLEKILLQ